MTLTYFSENAYYALSLALIVPMGLLFFIPLRKFLRVPLFVCLLMNISFYALLYFIVPPLIAYSNDHNLLVMIPVIAAFFVFCRLVCTLDTIRCGAIFLWAGGLMSFASVATRVLILVDDFQVTDITIHIIRLACAVFILLLEVLLTKSWDPYFISDPNVPIALWLAFLPIPVILFYQNINLISYNSSMVEPAGALSSFILMFIGNFVCFVLLTNLFHSNCIVYIENAKISEEKALLELQQSQYTTLTRTVDNTNKLLHDFKHTINTLKTLANEDGSEKILSYLEKMEKLDTKTEILNYCKHAPINSVLNHYALRAKTEEVPLNLQVDIPGKIPMKDHEICSLLGNLMENAIDACLVLDREDRYFSLSIVMEGKNLYIVSSNSFDGIIKKTDTVYLSTKHPGHGIGIRSMKETVEQYGGEMKVHYKDKEFFVDILLSFN